MLKGSAFNISPVLPFLLQFRTSSIILFGMKLSLSSFFVIAIVGSILLFHPVIVKGEEPAPSEKAQTGEFLPQDGTSKQVIPTEVKPAIDEITPQPGRQTEAPALPPAEGITGAPEGSGGVPPLIAMPAIFNWL